MPTSWKPCLVIREHPQRSHHLMYSEIKNKIHRQICCWDALVIILFQILVAIIIMIPCPYYLHRDNHKYLARILVQHSVNKFMESVTQCISWHLNFMNPFPIKYMSYSRCKVRWLNLCNVFSNIGGIKIIKT